MKTRNDYPNRKQFKEFVELLSERIKESADPSDIGTFFAFPTEAADPINGMHEFPYELVFPGEKPKVKDPKCIHCGKKKSEIN